MSERPSPDLASAMYPSLSRAAKQREAEQRRVDDWRQQQRNFLLEALRETSRRIDARMRKEGRR
jgi:hypothetical protein